MNNLYRSGFKKQHNEKLKGIQSRKYATYEKVVDISIPLPKTFDHYKKPLRPEMWLERANTAFRQGIPTFHIPRSDVFYIKALIRDKLGYDLPVLMVERLLIEEGMLTEGGVPVKSSEADSEKTSKTDTLP